MPQEVTEAQAADHSEHPGFVLDVPVTLTVTVRGPGITRKEAIAAGERFSRHLSENAVTVGMLEAYNSAELASGGSVVIRAAHLEDVSEEIVEVLDYILAGQRDNG